MVTPLDRMWWTLCANALIGQLGIHNVGNNISERSVSTITNSFANVLDSGSSTANSQKPPKSTQQIQEETTKLLAELQTGFPNHRESDTQIELSDRELYHNERPSEQTFEEDEGNDNTDERNYKRDATAVTNDNNAQVTNNNNPNADNDENNSSSATNADREDTNLLISGSQDNMTTFDYGNPHIIGTKRAKSTKTTLSSLYRASKYYFGYNIADYRVEDQPYVYSITNLINDAKITWKLSCIG